jgi:phospholipid-transporting ATPase
MASIEVSARKRAKATRKKGANAQNVSRYSWWTFVPKFALEQLTQLSTIYFLVIALLQQIPDFSPTGN